MTWWSLVIFLYGWGAVSVPMRDLDTCIKAGDSLRIQGNADNILTACVGLDGQVVLGSGWKVKP